MQDNSKISVTDVWGGFTEPILNASKRYQANVVLTSKFTQVLPTLWESDWSVYFDNQVVKFSKNLKPSKRKEIEIVDLLNKYKRKNKLSAEFLGRGGAWLDTGSIKDFYDTSAFVSALEKRQGLKIACLEEIALNNKWINKKNIEAAIKFYGKCSYSQYLSTLKKSFI